MADPQFTVARGGANAGPLNMTENIIRALTRIAVRVREEVGEDAAQEALTLGFDQIDTDDPSVADLEGLAEQVDVDLTDLLDGGADAGGGAGDDAAAASANSSVSLTVNTRRVAEAHGLPTDWHALEGIDLPPSLADANLDDEGLAAAINTAQGWKRVGGKGIPPRRVANLRDKGISYEAGASLEDVTDTSTDDEAGLNSLDLDRERPLSVPTVKNRVAAHMHKTGRDTGRNSDDVPGASLDDFEEE